MRFIQFVFLIFYCSTLLYAVDVNHTLTVKLANVQDEEANLYLYLYDSSSSWLNQEEALHEYVVTLNELNKPSFSIQLKPGDYAFTLFQDINSNKRLDSNFIGIPKEPVAVSKNKYKQFGPPKFKDNLFYLNSDLELLVEFRD